VGYEKCDSFELILVHTCNSQNFAWNWVLHVLKLLIWFKFNFFESLCQIKNEHSLRKPLKNLHQSRKTPNLGVFGGAFWVWWSFLQFWSLVFKFSGISFILTHIFPRKVEKPRRFWPSNKFLWQQRVSRAGVVLARHFIFTVILYHIYQLQLVARSHNDHQHEKHFHTLKTHTKSKISAYLPQTKQKKPNTIKTPPKNHANETIHPCAVSKQISKGPLPFCKVDMIVPCPYRLFTEIIFHPLQIPNCSALDLFLTTCTRISSSRSTIRNPSGFRSNKTVLDVSTKLSVVIVSSLSSSSSISRTIVFCSFTFKTAAVGINFCRFLFLFLNFLDRCFGGVGLPSGNRKDRDASVPFDFARTILTKFSVSLFEGDDSKAFL